MPVGWSGSDAQQLEMLVRGFEIDLGVVLGVLRDFQSALGDRSVLEQQLGAIQLDLRQLLVLDGLAIVGKRAGDVGASHLEQELALLHFVAQPRVDFDHPPGGQRRHRHLPRNVGTHHAGDVQLRRGDVLAGRRQRKLLRMVHLEVVGVHVGLDAVAGTGPVPPSLACWRVHLLFAARRDSESQRPDTELLR